MKFLMNCSRIEFLVLVLLLFSFFMLPIAEERKQTYSYYYYVDLNATGANDGSSPTDAWESLDDLCNNWNTIQPDALITIMGGTYTPDNTIEIQQCDITFQGDPASPVYIVDDDLSNGSEMIHYDQNNQCHEVRFDSINFICDTASYGDEIIVSEGPISGSYFRNCYFEVDDTFGICADNVDNMLFDNCEFVKADDTVNMVLISECSNVEFVDCEFSCGSATGVSFHGLLDIEECDTCDIHRCKFFTGASNDSNFGVRLLTNENVSFYNNVIMGNFNFNALFDSRNISGLAIDFNTIINNSDSSLGGIGFEAYRVASSACPIDSFRNNIVVVESDSYYCYPIYVHSAADWKPSNSMCDYNCYYTTGSQTFVGKWDTSVVTTIGNWRTTTNTLDQNSVSMDPSFSNGWRMSTTTNSAIIHGGLSIDEYDRDIDNGLRWYSVSAGLYTSMGADQYSEAVFMPYLPGPLDFGTTYDEMNVYIMNYGLSDFVISDITLTNTTTPGAYNIIAGGSYPVYLSPGDIHTITIAFNETGTLSSGNYYASLAVEHNAFMNHGTISTDTLPIQGNVP